MLQLRHVTKKYDTGAAPVIALNDVTVSIERGEFVMIVGESGSGKSTLLHVLSGMDQATTGVVLFEGEDLVQLKSRELARLRREKIGMIFQQFNLLPRLSTFDNIALPLRLAGIGRSEIARRVTELLKRVGLGDRATATPQQLSGGQQQRVAIARALALQPAVLLCDEPTGNLDSKNGQQIIDLLRELHRHGQTIVMVTHNENYLQYATRVVKMVDGKVVIDEKKQKPTPNAPAAPTARGTVRWRTLLGMAGRNIRQHKLRVALTVGGIAVGTMAIVTLVSFAAGAQRSIIDSFSSVTSADTITVSGDPQNAQSFDGRSNLDRSNVKPLNDGTIDQLKTIDHVRSAYPTIAITGDVQLGDKTAYLVAIGAAPQSVETESSFTVVHGSYFQKDDEQSILLPAAAAEVLVGQDVAQIVGKTVTVKNLKTTDKTYDLKVVGIIDTQESPRAELPHQTAVTILRAVKAAELEKSDPALYDTITLRADKQENVNTIKQVVIDRGFSANTLDDLISAVGRVLTIVKVILGVVGGVALLVAALGVINTMLMAVLERRREIGILKAVGARNGDVRNLFTSEAGAIGLLGGLFGLLLGFGVTQAIALGIRIYVERSGTNNPEISFYISPLLALFAIAFAAIVTMVAGLLPARRAANLNPIAALKEE